MEKNSEWHGGGKGLPAFIKGVLFDHKAPPMDENAQRVEELTEQVKNLSERENQHYTDIMMLLKKIEDKMDASQLQAETGMDEDEIYEAAKEAVIEIGKASTSYLQRTLNIGYSRAARLIDKLEEDGVIGKGDGAKPREVLIKPEDA